MNNIKMLYYDRIDVSEGIDVNQISSSKECDICHYWYFLHKGFKIQPDVCNVYHDVLTTFVNLDDIAVPNIYSVNYQCIISKISRSEAVNLMQNIDLTEKSRTT